MPVTIGEDNSYFHASSQRKEGASGHQGYQPNLTGVSITLFLINDYANWFAVSVLTVLAI